MTTRNLLACAISAAIATAACAADNGETLETIFIKTQRGYSADATETNRDYSAFAATVGTKIPATPREIPQSISIITSQQIKDRNVETLDQLARKTPGLRVLSNDDGRSSIYARGYEYDEYNVNGLPAQMQSINGTLPNLAAFDRVEIMRGPSGLFDSSGEMGGLVNLVRKRPGEDFDASASAGYGTEKQYKLGGDITGKLNADGTIRGRVLAETTGKSPKPCGGAFIYALFSREKNGAKFRQGARNGAGLWGVKVCGVVQLGAARNCAVCAVLLQIYLHCLRFKCARLIAFEAGFIPAFLWALFGEVVGDVDDLAADLDVVML